MAFRRRAARAILRRMRNLFLGLLLGLAVGGGLYLHLPPHEPCQVCGAGTVCKDSRCIAAAPTPTPTPPPVRRRVRRGQGGQGPGQGQTSQAAGQSPEEPPSPPAIVLSAGDLKQVIA